MTTATIREKLHDYINNADDKKIKALYTVLDGEIEKTYNWWEDEEFVKELEKEHKDIVQGKAKTYTAVELDAELNRLRKKHQHELQK